MLVVIRPVRDRAWLLDEGDDLRESPSVIIGMDGGRDPDRRLATVPIERLVKPASKILVTVARDQRDCDLGVSALSLASAPRREDGGARTELIRMLG
jgi:hypothetical protein